MTLGFSKRCILWCRTKFREGGAVLLTSHLNGRHLKNFYQPNEQIVDYIIILKYLFLEVERELRFPKVEEGGPGLQAPCHFYNTGSLVYI